MVTIKEYSIKRTEMGTNKDVNRKLGPNLFRFLS